MDIYHIFPDDLQGNTLKTVYFHNYIYGIFSYSFQFSVITQKKFSIPENDIR